MAKAVSKAANKKAAVGSVRAGAKEQAAFGDKYIVDLDGTLTTAAKGVNYSDQPLNTELAAAVKAAKAQGYGVEIFTARNMLSLKGDLEKINKQTKPVAAEWLKVHKVEHDELIVGKPYCGLNGFYVDDKNLHPEEFIFRTTGPFAGQTVDVVIPFYNEELNIEHAHGLQKRLERLLEVRKFIYVNNGSKDKTGAKLDELAKQDSKVQVVHVKVNKGYGFGMKSGIKAAQADWVMTNHADGQFDGYTFLLTHMMALMPLKEGFTILPRRLNRPFSWAARTWVLRMLASILAARRLGEFNGQPKMWRRELLEDIDGLPDDFCLDIAVYMQLSRKERVMDLPILEKGRFKGVSSWAGQMRRTWRLSLRYLEFAWAMRGK